MRLETNKIYKGDCIEIMEGKIPDETINLIYADPPYNLSGNALKWKGNKTGGDWYMMNEDWDKISPEEYFAFTFKWVEQAKRVLKNNGSVYISCTYHNIGELLINLKRLGMKINNVITWYKTNAMPNMTKRVFTHSTEYVIWAVKGKKWRFNYEKMKDINPERQKNGAPKQMRDLWKSPLCQGKERIKGSNGRAIHPTQKPETLIERIILASSKEGDIILDPFFGVGTTGVVAGKLNRRWIGIEINNKYIKYAKKRIAQSSFG